VQPVRPLAVLLDLDGTLVDTVPLILASVRHAFDGRRRAPDERQWVAGMGMPLRVQLAAWAEDGADLELLVSRYRDFQGRHQGAMMRAYDGAVAAVEALKARGHPVAVVTGKLAGMAGRTLAQVGLDGAVDALVGSDSCPHHKPHPEPVLLALERLGRAPAEGLFVGDSVVDVQAGRAAGVTTVAALWGATAGEVLLAQEPHHVLGDVRELPALVERLAKP
jgi:pyrophosphatase PpaX